MRWPGKVSRVSSSTLSQQSLTLCKELKTEETLWLPQLRCTSSMKIVSDTPTDMMSLTQTYT